MGTYSSVVRPSFGLNYSPYSPYTAGVNSPFVHSIGNREAEPKADADAAFYHSVSQPTLPTPLVCTAPSSTPLARGRPSLQLMLMLLSTIVSTAPQLTPSLDTLDTLDTPDTPDTLDTLHLKYTVTSSTTSTTIIKQCNVNQLQQPCFQEKCNVFH